MYKYVVHNADISQGAKYSFFPFFLKNYILWLHIWRNETCDFNKYFLTKKVFEIEQERDGKVTFCDISMVVVFSDEFG